MNKCKASIVFLQLSLSAILLPAFAIDQSTFSLSPNALQRAESVTVERVEFGTDVQGVFIPESVSNRCECLLIWNGSSWNEDLYYANFGESLRTGRGFFRPYNHSPKAYPIAFDKNEWSKLKRSHQFYKAFKSNHFVSLKVIQLDSPHAPFVYVEADLEGRFQVFRLETPQDLSPNVEAWLKKADFRSSKAGVGLSLTYDLYQTGTGREPDALTVDYQYVNGSWLALKSK